MHSCVGLEKRLAQQEVRHFIVLFDCMRAAVLSVRLIATHLSSQRDGSPERIFYGKGHL